MKLDQLAKLELFYKELGINLKEPLDFKSRFRMQKESFIVNEIGKLQIFDLISMENDYSWYIRGVYSQNIANAYYSIMLNRHVLDTIDIKSLNGEFVQTLKKVKEFFNKFKQQFKVKKGFGKFDDLLELYSSIIYFQNYQKLDNYNEIWKTIKLFPTLQHHYDYNAIFF